ncbi:hypothetical protein GOODEAATRI_030527, partial [Goodea atripinnis]
LMFDLIEGLGISQEWRRSETMIKPKYPLLRLRSIALIYSQLQTKLNLLTKMRQSFYSWVGTSSGSIRYVSKSRGPIMHLTPKD